MEIDVLVCDDLHLSRSALAALLERYQELRVVAAVDSRADALAFAESHEPDVVIISFEGEDDDAIEIAKTVATVSGSQSVLLTTTFTRPVVREAFAAGIRGIVERSASPRQFVEAIQRVHRGERVFDTERTVAALLNGGDCPLTMRELSVLESVSRGDTVAEIAACLHLSEGTVRNYLSSVVRKTKARNRIDALRIARESHWI
ncbi:response regulator transcription factor [Actinocrinis puniceicyclus]|uniref:Response regulator transcription factor n=1 Tax=Actinocrinis puniceicyclus TaxID=977794 RepID=A0A8J7WTJ7_9ACTN|nr:response regulator transcription factor [Actinocrinis puniceicyclus]MBS2965445.1 response regulator transcription factor [Actinocrinis puniceicyclus]